MSLLILPEDIIENIMDNISDINLYRFITINRLLNKECNKRSNTYGGILGLKYNILYDMTKLNRNNILENIGDKNHDFMEYWTKTNFRVFGLKLIKNSMGVSIWLNI